MNKLYLLLINTISFPFRIFSKVSALAYMVNSKVDKTAAICSFTKLYYSSIGKYSYIGRGCLFNYVTMGNYCSVAEGCKVGAASHPLSWVSTSPVFHQGTNVLRRNFSRHHYECFDTTVIGSDVWIGLNVFIKAGVKIGNGAVIGACSVVTKDVPPYAVVGGNPAGVLKYRFDEATIAALDMSKWWELGDEDIIKLSSAFQKPEELLALLSKR